MTSREPVPNSSDDKASPPEGPAADAAASPAIERRAATTKAKGRRKQAKAVKSPDPVKPLFLNDFDQHVVREFDSTWVIRALLSESNPTYLPVIFAGFCAWVVAPDDEKFRLNAMRLQLSRLMTAREKKLFEKVQKKREKQDFAATVMADAKYTAMFSGMYVPLGGIGKITAAGRRVTLLNDFKYHSKNFEFCLRLMQILHVLASMDAEPQSPQRKLTLDGALTYLATTEIPKDYLEKLVARNESITLRGKRASAENDKNPNAKLSKRTTELAWYPMRTTAALWYAAAFIKASTTRKKKNAKTGKRAKPSRAHETLSDQLRYGELSYRLTKPKIEQWLQTAAAINKGILGKLNLKYWKTKPVKLPDEIKEIRLPRPPISDPGQIEAIRNAFAAAEPKAKRSK